MNGSRPGNGVRGKQLPSQRVVGQRHVLEQCQDLAWKRERALAQRVGVADVAVHDRREGACFAAGQRLLVCLGSDDKLAAHCILGLQQPHIQQAPSEPRARDGRTNRDMSLRKSKASARGGARGTALPLVPPAPLRSS